MIIKTSKQLKYSLNVFTFLLTISQSSFLIACDLLSEEGNRLVIHGLEANREHQIDCEKEYNLATHSLKSNSEDSLKFITQEENHNDAHYRKAIDHSRQVNKIGKVILKSSPALDIIAGVLALVPEPTGVSKIASVAVLGGSCGLKAGGKVLIRLSLKREETQLQHLTLKPNKTLIDTEKALLHAYKKREIINNHKSLKSKLKKALKIDQNVNNINEKIGSLEGKLEEEVSQYVYSLNLEQELIKNIYKYINRNELLTLQDLTKSRTQAQKIENEIVLKCLLQHNDDSH